MALRNRFLQHPWPKWWSAKVDKLAKFDRLPFRTGLMMTYIIHTCKLYYGFLSPSRLIQGIPQNGLTINKFLAIPKIGS